MPCRASIYSCFAKRIRLLPQGQSSKESWAPLFWTRGKYNPSIRRKYSTKNKASCPGRRESSDKHLFVTHFTAYNIMKTATEIKRFKSHGTVDTQAIYQALFPLHSWRLVRPFVRPLITPGRNGGRRIECRWSSRCNLPLSLNWFVLCSKNEEGSIVLLTEPLLTVRC
jgi:hypothetical protein